MPHNRGTLRNTLPGMLFTRILLGCNSPYGPNRNVIACRWASTGLLDLNTQNTAFGINVSVGDDVSQTNMVQLLGALFVASSQQCA